MIESWLPVTGFEGRYEISDHGRVWSCPHIKPGRSPQGEPVTRQYKGKFLSPRSHGNNPHVYVDLYRDGSARRIGVSQLVLEHFVGQSEDGQLGLHWDDNPLNNHVLNLRWGTPSENNQDCVRNGNNYNANKTHCPQRHEYTPENTYMYKGGRQCRTCAKAESVRQTHKRSLRRSQRRNGG